MNARHPATPAERLGALRQVITSNGFARIIEAHSGLSALGLDTKDLELIVKEGFYGDRADNNPKSVSVDNVRSILQSVY